MKIALKSQSGLIRIKCREVIMKSLSVVLAAIVAITLTGCGTVSQLTADRKANEINAKYVKLYSQAESINRLRTKILIPPEENRTLEQLSDDSFPSSFEKEALLIFDRIATAYEAEFLLFMEADAIKAEVPITRDFVASSRDNRLDLFRGLISFGQYNRNAKALRDTFDKLISQVAQMTDEQRRQAWANAFTSFSAAQAQGQRSPIKTNCTSYGSSTSCTSR